MKFSKLQIYKFINMNVKNYKPEVMTIISDVLEQGTSSEHYYYVIVLSEAVATLDDEVCLNKYFMDSIWSYYCKNIPMELSRILFSYTSYSTQKIVKELVDRNNSDIFFVEDYSYKIHLDKDEAIKFFGEEYGEHYDSFDDILEIPICFDLNTKQWYIREKIIYGTTNIYDYNEMMKIIEYVEDKKRIENEIKLKIKEKEEQEKKLQKQLEREEKKRQNELAKEELRLQKRRDKEEKRKQKEIEKTETLKQGQIKKENRSKQVIKQKMKGTQLKNQF